MQDVHIPLFGNTGAGGAYLRLARMHGCVKYWFYLLIIHLCVKYWFYLLIIPVFTYEVTCICVHLLYISPRCVKTGISSHTNPFQHSARFMCKM